MPKKSDSAKVKKLLKGSSPKLGKARKLIRGEGPGRGIGLQKKNRGMKSGAGRDHAFDNNGKSMGGSKPKDGCLPKLFMLLLPFAAVGVYFFLQS
jgi:hypothetical protein